MNVPLIFSLIGSAGFLAGVAALLHFFNTRTSARTKGGAEAYQAYRTFVHGATDDRDKEINRLKGDKVSLLGIREKLIDLAQRSFQLARDHGIAPEVLEPFYDELDDVRRM